MASKKIHALNVDEVIRVGINNEDAFRNIRAFGAEPMRLTPPSKKLSDRFFDVILLLGSLVFIVFAAIALHLDQKPVELYKWGETILKAERLGPTIFPILFAVIVGNMTAALARWRLERGERLHIIEQLQASSSLAGTFTIGYKLQRLSLPFLALIALWSLSPLGGQASLRLLDKYDFPLHSTRNLSYVADEANKYFPWATVLRSNNITDDQLNVFSVRSFFISSLLAPSTVRSSPVDWMGNMKLPFLEYLNGYRGDEDDSWVDVDDSPGYASLIGWQIIGLQNTSIDETNTFQTEGSYISFNCSPRRDIRGEVDDLRLKLQAEMKTINETGSTLIIYDKKSTLGIRAAGVWSQLGPKTNDNSILTGKKIDFYFWGSYFQTTCIVKQRPVEAKVQCKHYSCQALALRPLPPPDVSSPYSAFDMLIIMREVLQAFIEVAATGGQASISDFKRSVLDSYLIDPENPFLTIRTGIEPVPILQKVTDREFELRLAQIFNTMYRASMYWIIAQGGSPLSNPETVKFVTNSKAPMNNVTAQSTTHEERFVCDKTWFTVLIVCSAAMFLAAVLGTYVGLITLGPDILGYVSSLTRDNPNCPLPLDSSAMDGPERTRKLGHTRIQLRDVLAGADSHNGHLSLTWAEGNVDGGKKLMDTMKHGFDAKKEYC